MGCTQIILNFPCASTMVVSSPSKYPSALKIAFLKVEIYGTQRPYKLPKGTILYYEFFCN